MIAFPSPRHVRDLASGTREHTLASLALRTLRRDLLGRCERLRDRLGKDTTRCFGEFVDVALAAGHPMDWTLHLDFGVFCGVDEPHLWDELCVAAARRWVRSSSCGESWLAVSCAASPDRVVVGLRARSLDDGPAVLRGSQRVRSHLDQPFRYQTGEGPFTELGTDWRPYRPRIPRQGVPR
jgi:hypothetical protein